jgi:hypothetical protein
MRRHHSGCQMAQRLIALPVIGIAHEGEAGLGDCL